MGAMFKDLFPNIELVCNWDHRYAIEHFDVYIRGVGPLDRRFKFLNIFLLEIVREEFFSLVRKKKLRHLWKILLKEC